MSSRELALIGPELFSPPLSARRFSVEDFLEGIFLLALRGPEPLSGASAPIDDVLLVLHK